MLVYDITNVVQLVNLTDPTGDLQLYAYLDTDDEYSQSGETYCSQTCTAGIDLKRFPAQSSYTLWETGFQCANEEQYGEESVVLVGGCHLCAGTAELSWR